MNEKLQGHVLIAEDTPELQLLERRILKNMGLTVVVVNDGQEAIEQVEQHHFDLILMDIQMPNVDGIEATRTLRQRGYTLPIVALTANVTQRHQEGFEEAGGDGFLGKPVNTVELRKMLKHYLCVRPPGPSPEPPATVAEEVDEELMEIFLQSSAERAVALQQLLKTQEWGVIRDLAHTIKGTAASFGHPELSVVAESLQMAIDRGEGDEVVAGHGAELLSTLQAVLPQTGGSSAL
jgi:CheY-like chemotaxis protein